MLKRLLNFMCLFTLLLIVSFLYALAGTIYTYWIWRSH